MQKVWLKSYAANVPAEINIGALHSIPDLIEESILKFGNKPAFTCMGKTLTFDHIDDLSKRFAVYLTNELSLKKGDRVAIMMPNFLQYPVALFGILRAGLIVVNVNPLYTTRELEHQLKDSGAKAIVILANFANKLEKAMPHSHIQHVIVTEAGDLLSFPKSLVVNFVIKKIKKMVPNYFIPNAVNFNSTLSKSYAADFSKADITLEDIAFLQYTGGTTGVSKGAILTHSNIVHNMAQAHAWIANNLELGKEIIITPLPLYHIFSLTANCFVFFSVGALNVLIPNPRDFKAFVGELKKWKFTCFTGVNTLFNGLVNDPEFRKLDFSSFKLALGGGMAVQKVVAEKWKVITGTPLIEAYGLTETSPAACMNPLTLPDFNGYIGLPISSTEVSIRDEDEKELAFNEPGEICIKGPQVMRGYWNRPEESEKAFTKDGFFKSGDIGYMTAAGYIKIVDRKKDMILVSGFNVYPLEVEEVVASHPGVMECAAIGIPDEKSGEVVKLFVVKKDLTLTADALLKFCKQNLTGYKVPRSVEFRNELPKSNVGKILRRELRSPS